MQNFHKELEALKNSGYSTGELRRDIEEMEKVFFTDLRECFIFYTTETHQI